MRRTTHSAQRTTQLIVALDVDSLEEARRLLDLLYPAVKIFKVGAQLFTAAGPKAVDLVRRKGGRVFLDLKFHDIPNTVANAVRQATSLRVFMLDVHIQGGKEMLRAAANSAKEQAKKLGIKKPLVLGITVLTSQKANSKVKKTVLEQSRLAKKYGLDGIVASPQEARLLRSNLGKDFIIVTPGIRLEKGVRSDQKRTATPAQAALSGSDYLVIGRPVIQAKNPLTVVKETLNQICYRKMR